MTTETKYIDNYGNTQTGYIIDGHTYKDPQGTAPIASGSKVTTADGKTYIKYEDGSAQMGNPIAPSYQDLLNSMYDNQTKANQAALTSTYEQNQAALNRTAQAIPGTYQAAKNTTAGQSEVQRSNFNEYAAASGLNSGAGGQAQLAMSNTLQSNLSALDNEQASKLADLDLQRSNLETSYRSAIQQLVATGDFQKAQALYDAYQTEQDRLLQTSQFNATLGQNQQQIDASTDNTAYGRTLEAAGASGVYDAMAAYGWTPEQITSAERAYALATTPTYSGRGGGSSSQSALTYSPITASQSTFPTINASTGQPFVFNAADPANSLPNYMQQSTTGSTTASGTPQSLTDYNSIKNSARSMSSRGSSKDDIADYLFDMIGRGITLNQASEIAASMGIDI